MKKIAVITPYYKEDTAVLKQCHDSVLAQEEVDAHHFLVADGFPNQAVCGWRATHVPLPRAHGDNGNTPRAVGSLLADVEGYDFVAYLDADNWYHPEHLKSLLALHEETGEPVCTSFRTYHTLDGTQLHVSESDEDCVDHVDTSCYLLHRSAFGLAAVWSRMPKLLSPICDRVFLAAVRKEKFRIASSRARTVAFRSQYQCHYVSAGLTPPRGAKGSGEVSPSLEYLWSKPGIDECFERLGFWPPTYFPPAR